jgi:predicted glycoside hydrolase/deacetylase ChbG (UPF0249 family)
MTAPALRRGHPPSNREGKAKTLAERLGFPRDTKLLVVHADDLGMTHSINAATIEAFETGLVNSGSVMAPCAWFPEVAAYAQSHPDTDLGLHLTLTSERVFNRWGPLTSRDQVPTLVDQYGYFHQDWPDRTQIEPREAELEIRAQVERAHAFGFRPTHLDSHQYRLYRNGKPLFEALVRVGRDYGLPVFVSRDWFAGWPYLEASLSEADVPIDRSVTIPAHVPAERWATFYADAVRSLTPGVTAFIIHLAYDDAEMRAFSRERESWGAAWRQRDLEFFTSNTFRDLLDEHHIRLVTWRDIGGLVGRPLDSKRSCPPATRDETHQPSSAGTSQPTRSRRGPPGPASR